jgi:hypothetical protein
MKPTPGRMVTALGYSSNGSIEHPAIITRVWSDQDPADAVVLVNLTMFPDMESPKLHGSVQIFNTRAEAEAFRAEKIAQGWEKGPLVCFWPDRV